jgi:hypothetical protein
MREVLSLATFNAVEWTNKPDYCLTELSGVRGCGTQVLATALGAIDGR